MSNDDAKAKGRIAALRAGIAEATTKKEALLRNLAAARKKLARLKSESDRRKIEEIRRNLKG
jgi:hypothetical protein